MYRQRPTILFESVAVRSSSVVRALPVAIFTRLCLVNTQLRAGVLYIICSVDSGHMSCETVFSIKNFGTDVTLEGLDVTYVVYTCQMTSQMRFVLENHGAGRTRETIEVVNSVNSSLVQTHARCCSKRLSANLTSVYCVIRHVQFGTVRVSGAAVNSQQVCLK